MNLWTSTHAHSVSNTVMGCFFFSSWKVLVFLHSRPHFFWWKKSHVSVFWVAADTYKQSPVALNHLQLWLLTPKTHAIVRPLHSYPSSSHKCSWYFCLTPKLELIYFKLCRQKMSSQVVFFLWGPEAYLKEKKNSWSIVTSITDFKCLII